MKTTVSQDDLRRYALLGLAAERDRLDALSAALSEAAPTAAKTKGKRAPMSAAGRARIAAAQKRRWKMQKKAAKAAVSPASS